MTDEQFRAEVLARLDMMLEGFKSALGYLNCIDAKLHGVVVPTPEHKDQIPNMAVRIVQGAEDKSRRFVPHDFVPAPEPVQPPAGKKGKK